MRYFTDEGGGRARFYFVLKHTEASTLRARKEGERVAPRAQTGEPNVGDQEGQPSPSLLGVYAKTVETCRKQWEGCATTRF